MPSSICSCTPGPASDISARLASPDDYRVGSPDLEVAMAS